MRSYVLPTTWEQRIKIHDGVSDWATRQTECIASIEHRNAFIVNLLAGGKDLEASLRNSEGYAA